MKYKSIYFEFGCRWCIVGIDLSIKHRFLAKYRILEHIENSYIVLGMRYMTIGMENIDYYYSDKNQQSIGCMLL